MNKIIMSLIALGFGTGLAQAADPADVLLAADRAFAAKSGDLGYTWGKATITGSDKAISHSRYVTVWQKQPDGQWKFILDFGADEPAP